MRSAKVMANAFRAGFQAQPRGSPRRRDRRHRLVRLGLEADLLRGSTPKHHESDTHVRRGRITRQGSRPGQLGGDRVGQDPLQDQRSGGAAGAGRRPSRLQHRLGGCRSAPTRARLLSAARRPRARPGTHAGGGMNTAFGFSLVGVGAMYLLGCQRPSLVSAALTLNTMNAYVRLSQQLPSNPSPTKAPPGRRISLLSGVPATTRGSFR
jgi:hypothetical protein